MLQRLQDLDTWLFFAINSCRHAFLDASMPTFSERWLLWFLGICMFGMWTTYALRQRKIWANLKPVFFGLAFILCTAGVTDIIVYEAKDATARLRPYHSLPFAFHRSHEGDWVQNPGPGQFKPKTERHDSFFSGHAANSMTVAVGAATLCPAMSPVILAMPLVVGYSRLYLGKHYPSDVLCGWLVGICTGLLARRLTRGLRKTLWGEAKKKDRS